MYKLSFYRIWMNDELLGKFESLSLKLYNRELAEKLGFDARNSTNATHAINRIKKRRTFPAHKFPLFLGVISRQPSTLTRKDIEIYGMGSNEPVNDEIFNEIIKFLCGEYDNKS